MTAVCVDTTAYSRFMRGHAPLVARMEEVDFLWVPTTVLGELFAGFEIGARREVNRRKLAYFLRRPGVKAAPVTSNVAERYGLIISQLRRRGTPIPTNDIWIAATALETGSRLLAYDTHFDSVPGILVESP